jgi:acetoin utilization protein AcuB
MKTVGQYMTPAPKTIGADQLAATAMQLMRAYDVRHLPVLQDGRLVGMISDRELPLLASAAAMTRVSALMNPGPYSASPHTALAVVARDMAEHKIESVIVEEAGHVVGILTVVDVARALAETLREDETSAHRSGDRFAAMIAR